ncbi:MAG: hypothetical protein V4584_00485 [Verrucomicrobiota bacterium]
MTLDLSPVSYVSSWPEWLACVLVIAAVMFGRGFKKTAAVGLVLVIGLGWIFGTAKGLLFPLAVGGVLWIFSIFWCNRWQRVGEILAIAGALATALLCWLFPIPVPPPLAGPHGVGTMNLELAADGDSPRLLAQVWYPTDQVGGIDPVPWLPDAKLAPSFPYHRLAYAHSRAHSRARLNALPTVVERPLPVIFYEHSWLGHRAENIVQVETLASRGFVIVAVDHPGQAERVRYSDGTVVRPSVVAPLDYSSLKAAAAFQTTAERCFAERMANVGRVRLALKGDVAGNLRGRLSLDQVGVFGFSFGGSSALRLCAANPAFHAGANEDGLFLGTVMPRGPFLFFDQEMPSWLMKAPQPGEDFEKSFTRIAEEKILNAMREPARERVIIDGTRHLSFSDRIYASPLSRLARVGTRSSGEVHGILSERLNDFFRRALNVPDDSGH